MSKPKPMGTSGSTRTRELVTDADRLGGAPVVDYALGVALRNMLTLGVPMLVGLGCGGPLTAAPQVVEPTVDAQGRGAKQLPFVSPYSYANYARGEVLAARGQHGDAVEAYRAALSESDDDAWIQYRLVLALLAQDRRDEALALVQEGLSLQPAAGALWMARGEVALAAGRQDEAIAAYERAETAPGGDAEPTLRLAQLLRESGHPRRAIAVLERAAANHGLLEASGARARLELAVHTGDGEQIERAMATLFPLQRARRRELLALATTLIARNRPWLASELLAGLPPDADSAVLQMRLLLKTGQRARAAHLLSEISPAWLGGAGPASAAWLEVDEPARAIELAHTAATAGTAGHRHQALLLMARAHLALGDAVSAATVATQVPADSHLSQPARALAVRALEAAGMPHLAEEVRGDHEAD